MKLFTTFSCCSLFFFFFSRSLSPTAPFFSLSDFISVSARFNRHRWQWLKQDFRTISTNWRTLYARTVGVCNECACSWALKMKWKKLQQLNKPIKVEFGVCRFFFFPNKKKTNSWESSSTKLKELKKCKVFSGRSAGVDVRRSMLPRAQKMVSTNLARGEISASHH